MANFSCAQFSGCARASSKSTYHDTYVHGRQFRTSGYRFWWVPDFNRMLDIANSSITKDRISSLHAPFSSRALIKYKCFVKYLVIHWTSETLVHVTTEVLRMKPTSPDLATLALALSFLLAAYLTYCSLTPPNPNPLSPTAALPEDVVAPGPGIIQARRLMPIILWIPRVLLTLYYPLIVQCSVLTRTTCQAPYSRGLHIPLSS